MNRGSNTKEYWSQKHINQYEVRKDYDYSKMGELSYIKVANDIIVSNQECSKIKSVLDVGCAVGKAVNFFKRNLPDWECCGVDFSPDAISAAKEKCPEGVFEERDILETPLDKDYGFITILETIEHIEEDTNYNVLNNILDHCEYCVLSTVDTVDDCFGEHISHYTINTFEEKGYDVLWKSYLDEINMPDGVYHYMIFLIKGKL